MARAAGPALRLPVWLWLWLWVVVGVGAPSSGRGSGRELGAEDPSGEIEQAFGAEGGPLSLPCSAPGTLGPGERLEWFFRGDPGSPGETLFSLSPEGRVAAVGPKGAPGSKMAPDSSLAIAAVSAGHAGYYQCSRYSGSTLVRVHRRVILSVLQVRSDPTEELQGGPGVALACSLTCDPACDEGARLVWRDGSGRPLQGGASERLGSALVSRLSLPEPPGSWSVQCSAARDGEDLVTVEYGLRVTRTGLPAIPVAAGVCVLVLLVSAVGVVIYMRRTKRQRGGCESADDVIHVYDVCGETEYALVTPNSGVEGQVGGQPVSDPVYSLISAVN